ncbi:hypothetical protein LEN26_006432 [Aphanomyces euteiches]|nr:hypothetical protein AeMF1_012311 [Aphanomyces euteiches]KAH9135403.1 hypothetical protein LEN26_006432 [Aphanomyces euteiches]KAH9194713.1 hypothetical protein AeNC1_003314 [Aphanomyces euteiches]
MLSVPLLVLAALGVAVAAFKQEEPEWDIDPTAVNNYLLESEPDTPTLPNFDVIVKAAYSVLTANFDDQMNATAPGPIEDIGFQHIKVQDALLAAQALSHRDFPQATVQFKSLLRHQWPNGFMPDLIYGPSVGSSLTWLPTNNTFYPGPAFWSTTDTNGANWSTSGILASPLLAETAMRIFYLAPLDTSMSTPVYTHEAMGFLCEVYPKLFKFHSYLLSTRQPSNTSLLSLRHPWESVSPIRPGWKDLLAPIKRASDFSQVISRLKVPEITAQAFADQAALFYPDAKTAIEDVYYPMLYLASCFIEQQFDDAKMNTKCAGVFDVVDTEFNAIFLRSAEALLEMAHLLYQPVTKLGFSCPVESMPRKFDIDHLTRVAATIKNKLQTDLWNPAEMIFHTHYHDATGLFPLYSSTLDESIQMGLLHHILPSPDTFHFFCDYYPISIYPCESSETAPRISLLIHNYIIYRGLIKNAMKGIARFLLDRTFAMIPALPHFHFVDMFNATTGEPASSQLTLSSTLAASIVLNMGLPEMTTPPSPDTPPIDRQGILIVMCIELVVAMGVAVGCVVFSVYFVVKRPRGDAQPLSPDDNTALSPQPTSPSSPEKQNLEESLLSDDEEHDVTEYGSFLSGSNAKPAQGMWSSVKGFVSGISPWG